MRRDHMVTCPDCACTFKADDHPTPRDERRCAHCDDLFEDNGKGPRRRFCSRTCRYAFHADQRRHTNSAER